METKTWYQPLEVKDQETGLFYIKWDVPIGMPVGSGLIETVPPESLQFPRWDSTVGFWKEDKDSIIEAHKIEIAALQTENNSLKGQIVNLQSSSTDNQNAVMDLMEMVSQLGGDANV